MKKEQPELVFNWYQLYSTKFINIIGLVCALILLSSTFLAAQRVEEMGALLKELEQSGEASKFKSLAYDLNPTVYVGNEDIEAFGEGNPVCADVDSDAISKLYAENSLYRQVELMTIRITNLSGLSSRLNLSALASFQSLKYVRVLCEVNCTATQVQSMLTGSNANVVVCYLVSIPQ